MDFLGNNPVANMDRVQFSLIYLVFIAVTLVVARWITRRTDKSADAPHPLPSAPLRPDPYEVAYLRGGEGELIDVVAMDLALRDYLELTGGGFKMKPGHPDPGDLSALDRAVFEAVKTGSGADEANLRDSTGLLDRIVPLCDGYRQKAEADQLLMPRQATSVARRTGLAAGAAIIGLGVYGIAVGFSRDDNRLGATGAIAFFAALALFLVVIPPQLSARGRAYVRRLQEALEPMRERTASSYVDAKSVTSDLVLLTAVFGSGLSGPSKLGGTRGAVALLGVLMVAALVVEAVWAPGPGLSEADKRYNAGVELQLQGRFEEAVSEFDEAMRLDPEYDNSALYFNRGISYRKLGEFERAIEDLDQALLRPIPQLDAGDEESTIQLRFYYYDHIRLVRGTAYLDLGHAQRAIEDLDRSIKASPDSVGGAPRTSSVTPTYSGAAPTSSWETTRWPSRTTQAPCDRTF